MRVLAASCIPGQFLCNGGTYGCFWMGASRIELYSRTPRREESHRKKVTCPQERESQCVLEMALSVSSAILYGVSGNPSLGAMPSSYAYLALPPAITPATQD